MSDNQKKELILGVMSDYSLKNILPFINSLKRTNFKGDLYLFIPKFVEKTIKQKRKYQNLYEILVSYDAKLIEFEDKYPYLTNFVQYTDLLPRKLLTPMARVSSRFVMYFLFLSHFKDIYSKVLLTDVRDVIFQKNPFGFNFKPGLNCFLEDKRMLISTCKYNSTWMKQAFGKEVLKEIGQNYISCAGVTLGTTPSILNYVTKMIDYLSRMNARKWGIDQAVHNYLIYTKKLTDLRLFENEQGPVINLAYKQLDTIKFDNNGYLVNARGITVNIVHQYDRHPEIMRKLLQKLELKIIHKPVKSVRLGTILRWHALKLILKNEVTKYSVVLDLGGYDGLILIKLKNSIPFLNLYLIDVNESGFYFAKKHNLTIIHASAPDLPIISNTIDTILCLDLIEHIKNDDALIEEISRVLKRNGKLILTTPKEDGISFPLVTKKTMETLNNRWGHVRNGYSYKSLSKILEKHNIIILKTNSYFNLLTKFAYMLNFSFLKPQKLKRLIYDNIVKLEPYLKYHTDEYIFICKKK